MKKFLAVSLIAVAIFAGACTKTKKEVDWVSTILLYILNKPTSPGDRCTVSANISGTASNFVCKTYQSGFSADEQSTDCTSFASSFNTYAPSGATLEQKKASVSACSTDKAYSTCDVKDAATSKNYQVVYYTLSPEVWNGTNDKSHCEGTLKGTYAKK